MALSDLIIGLVLGIVEGVTEFLPISSTGHLIIVGNLLNFTGERASTFEIVIQLAAILAVALLYRERIYRLLVPGTEKGFSGVRGLTLLALTSIPSMALGYLIYDFMKERLFTPITVALALVVGAVAIILIERRQASIEESPATVAELGEMSYKQAFLIGLGQCLSLWPGMSRSAATILSGMLVGLRRNVAVEYSFLAAIPVMLVASLYDLYKSREFLSAADLPLFAVGAVVSFIAAFIAVKTFIRLLNRWTLVPFAYYRIVLGIIVLIVLFRPY